MPVVVRDGHSIHYEVRGPLVAPPLLLIMGLGLSSRAWDRLPGRLEGQFRVITFDNRGTGLSGPIVSPRLAIADLADDAAAVLDAARVTRASVLGVSMGGMIAQELVLRHSSRVRSLMLGCTFASWLHGQKPAVRVTLKLLGINLIGARATGGLSRILVSPEFDRTAPGEFPRWFRQVGLAGRATIFRQMRAIVGFSTSRRLHEISAPTLVVTGTADVLVPPANSRFIQSRIRGARLVELAGAGHLFPLEREDETVRLLEAQVLAS